MTAFGDRPNQSVRLQLELLLNSLAFFHLSILVLR